VDTTSASDSVSSLLGVDHERLDGILGETKRHVGAGSRQEAARRFADFREGLERHIVLEEEVLFPVLEKLTGMTDGGPTAVMRAEHREIRRLLGEVASILEGESEGDTVAPMAALTGILLAHNGKEERILYPMADRALADAPERSEVMDRVRAL